MALFIPPIPALDNNGNPIDGAEWRFSLSGTTTPAPVYSDSDLGTSLGSTVQAGTGGRFPAIYLDPDTTYRARLYDGAGSPITNGDFDPYNSDGGGSSKTVSVADMGPFAWGTAAGDTAGFQALLNFAFSDANAKAYVFDITGDFTLNATLYGLFPDGAPLTRKFIGNARFAVAAGTYLEYAMVLAGYEQDWTGAQLFFHGHDGVYGSRRIGTALRLFSCNGSRFATIKGYACKRDLIYFDPSDGPATFMAGTAYEKTYPQSNNIDVWIDKADGYYIGSRGYTESNSFMASSVISANVQSGSANSNVQSSTVTVASSAAFAVDDFVIAEFRVTASTYTTIAADNASGTFIWAAGDPVAAGFVVGDTIQADVGGNSGHQFRITAFGGTSNRTITVTPKPVTTAATAAAWFQTVPRIHQIQTIPDSTRVTVFPWLDIRVQSGRLRAIHGCTVNVRHDDTATVRFGTVRSFLCGIGIRSAGLYGCRADAVLNESCDIGIVTGHRINSVNLGNVFGHIHSEATQIDLLQVSSVATQHTFIGGASLFGSRQTLTGSWQNGYLSRTVALSAGSDVRASRIARPLRNLSIHMGGYTYETGPSVLSASGYAGTTAQVVSNIIGANKTQVVGDSGTVTLSYDEDVARLCPNTVQAEVYWIGPTGAAPTGSLTFALDDAMASNGWAIAGTNPQTSTKPCIIRPVWDQTSKKVMLARFDAA